MVAAIRYDSMVWAVGVATSSARESSERGRSEETWRDHDRQLLAVAARRAALDAEELALIRKAISIQIWRSLGMISMREYLERRMGYGPQVAAERLRVADALDGLPVIEAALKSGELSYSAVRELTRIATRKTEEAWVDACRDKVLRQIEELVAEREPGDAPDTRPKPDLRPKRVSMDLMPAVFALMRQAQAALDAIRGERNDYNDLVGEAFRCLLAMHAVTDHDAAEHEGSDRADARSDVKGPPVTQTLRAQIATITKCECCGQGWQLAAGRKIALTAAELETAECNATHIGSLDGAPQRASSTIPPATERFVKHRDGYRCTVPGCRSSQNLEVHHIMHRAHGGTNDPSNLTTLCWGHHAAHHRGELHIAGKAPRITVSRTLPVPHVGDRAHACPR